MLPRGPKRLGNDRLAIVQWVEPHETVGALVQVTARRVVVALAAD